MAVETSALEAYALTKSRRAANGEMHIWRSPDLEVRSGQFVAVLGDQPSDVTFLSGMLSTLIEPSGGVLRIGGEETRNWNRRQRARLRARRVGLLFREPKLLPELSVLGNVALPLQTLNIPRQQAQERAQSALDKLGLHDLLAKEVSTLTPLEGQWVALARAIVNRPTIIVADEPTAALSPCEAEQFLNLLCKVCHEENIAILLGTCDPHVAGYAERTIRLPQASAVFPLTAEDMQASDFFFDLYDVEISPFLRPVAPMLNWVVKPLLYTTIVALLIVFLTFFGLRMAGFSDSLGSADALQTALLSASDSATYLGHLLHGDLGTYLDFQSMYYWNEENEKPIAEAVRRTFDKSMALLLLAMVLGGFIGVPLGLAAALFRHRRSSLLFLVAAIVGISTPSFFLALLLQILEINFYRRTGITLLPVGGFGWDSHIVLPALVLAARPVAQVARVTFVALAEVLDADYIRTAQAKGLNARLVIWRHALRNAGVPILTAMGTSLGFSLSSLPVVEAIFNWPGMGNLLLSAVRSRQIPLAATLTLILGIFFVLVHVFLDNLYRWIDPRLREEKTSLGVKRSWVDMLSGGWSGLREASGSFQTLVPWLRKTESEGLLPLPTITGSDRISLQEQQRRDAKIKQERRRAWIQSTAGSLPFALGAIILLALLGAVVVGQQLAPRSPYSPVSSVLVNGEVKYAPFAPTPQFPLGTDMQGRDILSLLLYGARRTFSLAFFAVLARILLGTVLGALAGWFSESLLDRVLMGLTQVIAAFPALLLAMVLIYAFGIRQGMWVFALALCLIGWGEAAQFVRGQVMYIREQDYIEGALATGLRDVQLLARHVLPNLVPSLVVLACLEMGGILMILGELGFIGVFIGGGWTTRFVSDALVTYFDVPEWGVMLSNSWRAFRSYPWMTFYPALAFTLAILGFNLFGEGLRRLTERLTLSMHRLINRYTLGAAFGIGALLLLAAEGTRSWPQFTSTASRFNQERAMADVRYLASPAMAGRGIDTPELDAAADYIAQQFAALGLQPAGAEINNTLTYFAPSGLDYRALESVPSLQLYDSSGQPLRQLSYRRDYVEVPDGAVRADGLKGEVVFLGMNRLAETWPVQMDASPADVMDKTLLITTMGLPSPMLYLSWRGAVLVVAPHNDYLTHRELVLKTSSAGSWWRDIHTPFLFISPEVADAILRHGGYSLEEALERQDRLQKDEGFLLRTGVDASVNINVSEIKNGHPRYVQALVPGTDEILDNEVVLVLAHYDGLGRDMDGTVYPGANKNASGVAVMLEIARLLKEGDYRPRRTILFVAWAGAELHEPPDFTDMLEARIGFRQSYRLAAVIELTGVGVGTNSTLLLERSTSGRLTEVLQQAARRSRVKASTLGTGIYGVYSYLYTAPDRNIPYISMTWEGSSVTAHTPQDTVENIQPDKLRDAGRVAALAVMYLAHEKEY